MIRKIAPAIVGILVFVLLTLLSTIVYAAAGAAAEPNALSRVAELAFQILVPLLSALGAYLAHRLIAAFEKRTGIDVSERVEALLDGWVERGIHAAEEWSYKEVKAKTTKLTGSEKLELAADYVLDLIKQHGLDAWTRDKVKALIESKLGVHRANGGKPALDKATPPPLQAA